MNEYQWRLLAKLMDKYTSIKKAIEIFKHNYPKCKRIIEIEQQVNNGKRIDEILNNNKLEKQIGFYCSYLPLSKSIMITIQQKASKDKLTKKLISNIGYPLLIFLCSLVVLTIFSSLVLPSMLSNLNVHNDSLLIEFSVVNIIKNIIVIALIVFVSVVLYVKMAKREKYLWMLLHNLKMDNLFKMLAGYQLANEMLALLQVGMSLDKCLDVIRFSSSNLSSILAWHLNNSLSNGQSFEESLNNEFVDESFRNICLYDLKEENFEKGLIDYLQLTEIKIENILRISTVTIQMTCYAFVAVVIVMAYQALLMPLEMLEGMQ